MSEYIRKMIDKVKNFKQFVNENQQFDFDPSKKEILKFINKIINKEKVGEFDSPFYKIVVGTPKVGDSEKIGFTVDDKNKWKEYFSTKWFDTDGVWSQRNFNQSIQRKTGKNRTLNYYITIDKNKDNIKLFWNKLSDLDNRLSNLSNAKKTPISYKTHRLLDAFVTHNDSLKIYYYDETLKQDIEKIMNEWVNINKIITGNRTHIHGVDVKDGGGSFGQILSKHIDKSLVDLIEKNGNKYTDEQYFEWIKKYLPNLIKQVKVG
jgi:hypothetical protein